MKKINRHMEKEIEKIIHSGMNKPRVYTTPFFTTNVMGRVEQLERNSIFSPIFLFILKPAMVVIILVNVFNFFVYNQSSLLNENKGNQLETVMIEYATVQNDFIVSDELLIDN